VGGVEQEKNVCVSMLLTNLV